MVFHLFDLRAFNGKQIQFVSTCINYNKLNVNRKYDRRLSNQFDFVSVSQRQRFAALVLIEISTKNEKETQRTRRLSSNNDESDFISLATKIRQEKRNSPIFLCCSRHFAIFAIEFFYRQINLKSFIWKYMCQTASPSDDCWLHNCTSSWIVMRFEWQYSSHKHCLWVCERVSVCMCACELNWCTKIKLYGSYLCWQRTIGFLFFSFLFLSFLFSRVAQAKSIQTPLFFVVSNFYFYFFFIFLPFSHHLCHGIPLLSL